MDEESFLGRGVAFPVEPDDFGTLSEVAGETDIEQSIRIILGTAPGERVMRPQFGCGIHERVFDTIDTTTRTLIEDDVRDALIEWEPRIEVQSVDATDAPGERGKLHIEIDYLVRSTDTDSNLVYPFYLEAGRDGR